MAGTPVDAFPVKTAARMSGLTPDVVRAWERRYGAVHPRRTDTGGARLFDRRDVARLTTLRLLVAAGRRIGDIARLETRELDALLRASHPTAAATSRSDGNGLGRTLRAIDAFDAETLGEELGDFLTALGAARFVREVAVPLLVAVGDRWATGTGSVADERMVSGVLRNLLSSMLAARAGRGRRRLILATPPGERHEIGLLLAALVAADLGFSVYHLGADLPAGEIALSARRADAAAVGLAVVYRKNRARAVKEVRTIVRALPASAELWLGGADAAGVAAAVGTKRIVTIATLDDLERELDRIGPGALRP